LGRLLSDDERHRALCFHFEQNRNRYTARRGVLRLILGRYLGTEPGALKFCYGPQGKPRLAKSHASARLRFNVTHSHGLALYALALQREVGIDLERVCDRVEFERIAAAFFSARERAALTNVAARVRQRAFFACWTRKEAYLKARGDGLTLPLDQFDVSLAPGDPARLLAVRGKPLEASRWMLQELSLGVDYVAALAVEGQGWRLASWDWSGKSHDGVGQA
jgi:4'-phosphopantetheinyl transferase